MKKEDDLSYERKKEDKAIIESDPNDTIEEAPTITEELGNGREEVEKKDTKDKTSTKNEVKNSTKGSNSIRMVKSAKISQFQAMALMGKALYGSIKKDREEMDHIEYLSSSSANEGNLSDEEKVSPKRSHSSKRRLDDKKVSSNQNVKQDENTSIHASNKETYRDQANSKVDESKEKSIINANKKENEGT